jgi:hypothetical protein
LVAYIGLVAAGMVLLTFASRTIVHRYVDRRVQQEVTRHTRETVVKQESCVDVVACRAFIDRMIRNATPAQRRVLLTTLVRSVTVREIIRLGLRGPRGRSGARGVRGRRGATGRTGARGPRGRTGATGARGSQGAKGDRGPQGGRGETGAGGAPGAPGPPGAPGAPGGPGGGNGPPCPPKNKHCT